MEILILLVPLSVLLALLIGAGFWWSVNSGQYDDLDGPAHRILADDDAPGTAPGAACPAHNADGGSGALTPINRDDREPR